MSSARSVILQRLNSASQSGPTHPGQAPLPALDAEMLTHFKAKLVANVISFDEVTDDVAIVDSVIGFLSCHQLPLRLSVVADPRLATLPWPEQLEVTQGRIEASDLNCLSIAAAAIAETGSVVMQSGHDSPTEANFLPDNFLCIVERATLLRHMESYWQRWRETDETTPAVINIISGPSRTADVEQTIQLGAHGPRRMHVIIKG